MAERIGEIEFTFDLFEQTDFVNYSDGTYRDYYDSSIVFENPSNKKNIHNFLFNVYQDYKEFYMEHPLVFVSEEITISGTFQAANLDGGYFYFGKENQNTFIYSNVNGWLNGLSLSFIGNVCFWIDNSMNNKRILDSKSDVVGKIRFIVKNGSIPAGSNVVVKYSQHNFILDNPLYNQQEALVNKSIYSMTITPKSSAQIMAAGFTQDQAERLTEIMQVPHGQDETGDEIVKLAQMGDIEGAKELLGGGEPPIKQRFVYFNGKQVIPMINNGGQ